MRKNKTYGYPPKTKADLVREYEQAKREAIARGGATTTLKLGSASSEDALKTCTLIFGSNSSED